MHACGHDGHTTMGIWTLLILQELQLVKKGSVRGIFQPAEEKLTGARSMIKAGAVGLVMEAGQTLLVERERTLALANEHNITIVAK